MTTSVSNARKDIKELKETLKKLHALEDRVERALNSTSKPEELTQVDSGEPSGATASDISVQGNDEEWKTWRKPPREFIGSDELRAPADVQITYPSVQKKYLDYLKKLNKRTEKGQDLVDWKKKNFPKTPIYGTHKQIDPKTGKVLETQEIFGPANWTEIWTDYKSIGDEYLIQIETNKQLLQQKIDSLMESQEKLKDIVFVNILGTGGFGTVWKVRARKMSLCTIGKPFYESEQVELACKVIRLSNTDYRLYGKDPEANETFVNYFVNNLILGDMLALRYLKHKNICNIIDMIHIPDSKTGFPFSTFCLFMDLCDGDIVQICYESPVYVLSEQQNKVWFKQIADAIAYLHTKENVVHLDIKPLNILYKYNGIKTKSTTFDELALNSTFKLCDFGQAISFNFDDKKCRYSGSTRGGTRGIQSWEWYRIKTVPTKPCDIHCFAATLVRCLLGGDYFNDNETSEGNTDFTPIKSSVKYPNLSQDVRDLILNMTVKSPFKRLTIEKVLTHNWLQ